MLSANESEPGAARIAGLASIGAVGRAVGRRAIGLDRASCSGVANEPTAE